MRVQFIRFGPRKGVAAKAARNKPKMVVIRYTGECTPQCAECFLFYNRGLRLLYLGYLFRLCIASRFLWLGRAR